LRVVAGTELREGLAERLRAEHGRLRFVQLAKARVEPGGERVRLQKPRAEAVDSRDPGAVEPACKVVPPTLGQSRADPRPQLAGRTARVRDHEDRVDVETAIADGADDSLDQDRRLAGAGAGRDEDLSSRFDRCELLLVHARSIRHIGQRSHHVGHSPPSGS
jgi:hypothetical protein